MVDGKIRSKAEAKQVIIEHAVSLGLMDEWHLHAANPAGAPDWYVIELAACMMEELEERESGS